MKYNEVKGRNEYFLMIENWMIEIFPSLDAKSDTWGRRIIERTGRSDADRWKKGKDRRKRSSDSTIWYCIVTAGDSEVPSIVPRRLVSAVEESGVVRHTERSRGCRWKLGVGLMKIESMGPGHS